MTHKQNEPFYEMGIPSNETYTPTAQDFLALMKALSRPGTATWQRAHRRRRVRFTTEAAVAATTSPDCPRLQRVQEGENEQREEGEILVRKEDLWYGSNDIATFKAQKAKMLEQSPMSKRSAIERKRYMMLSIRCTLSAQKQGYNSEDMALVAQKCSEWCTELAKIQGCHDYFDVYFPKLTSTLPNIAAIRPTKFPFPIIQTNGNNTNTNNSSSSTSTSTSSSDNKKRRRVPQKCCWSDVEDPSRESSSSSIEDAMQYRCVRQRRRTSLTA